MAVMSYILIFASVGKIYWKDSVTFQDFQEWANKDIQAVHNRSQLWLTAWWASQFTNMVPSLFNRLSGLYEPWKKPFWEFLLKINLSQSPVLNNSKVTLPFQTTKQMFFAFQKNHTFICSTLDFSPSENQRFNDGVAEGELVSSLKKKMHYNPPNTTKSFRTVWVIQYWMALNECGIEWVWHSFFS